MNQTPEQELSTLRSQLDAAKDEVKQKVDFIQRWMDPLMTTAEQELLTVRTERDALKREVVRKDEALRWLKIGSCSCGVKTNEVKHHAKDCDYRIASEALTPAAMEANQPHNPDRHLEEIDDSGERSDL